MLFRFASASALVAAASMAAAPLAAAELPRLAGHAVVATTAVFDADSVNADGYRRWHHRDRVDAGDVIAGVLVLGTIAAVASAASKSRQDREYRYPQRYPAPDRPYDYRSGSTDSRYNDGRGIDRAVDMCAREVERTARVDTVDGVDRNGDGWRVTGRLSNGDPFTCSIGNDGRIEGVDYGNRGAVNDGQWSDDRYAAARQAQDAAAPSYPGGPVGDEAADDDGRYDAAAAPDFEG
jgi:hypothetical protein